MTNRATTVLLVVDMLNDFFRQHAALAAQRTTLVAGINELTAVFRQCGHPIMWVRQEFAPDLSDSFLVMRKRQLRVTIAGTDGCEILSDLQRLTSEPVVVKKRYSAFFGTNLDERLRQLDAQVVAICGIKTHAWVRTTAIDAYQRDYDVIVASECIGSYDAEHHEVSKRYLGGGIARVLSNAEILNVLDC